MTRFPSEDSQFSTRGFLPAADPTPCFPAGSPYGILDEWGKQLPGLLQRNDFRAYVEQLTVPEWQHPVTQNTLPMLRLYYVRLGFLASAYINQVGQATAHILPANIAQPLCHICGLLERPPILSYDGYALYNWRRLDPEGPIALGNIDTIQNFVELYDEHWFILVHVEIEAQAAQMLAAIFALQAGGHWENRAAVNAAVTTITRIVTHQTAVLRRIPEHMSANLYFRTFRPYIRFFENVLYAGVDQPPINHRGETGAQSSVMPALIAFFKIPHRQSVLTDHLQDMRRYMPAAHRALLTRIEALPAVKPVTDPAQFKAAMDAIAAFREVHLGWAKQYIDEKVADPRGTGGTPYMTWLGQLIEETRAFGR